MAIFHLNSAVGSKSGGQSATAKAEYICREGKYATKDKDHVLFVCSGNMPSWAADTPHNYWQAADKYERANAALYRQVEFALPIELTDKQHIELAQEFSKDICKGQFPYTFAIHKKDGNPHCHLMFSERINDGFNRSPETWFKRAANKNKAPETGGARKATLGINRRAWLKAVREKWEMYANLTLRKAGFDEQISCKSLQDQGVTDRLPQIHLGAVAAMECRGIRTERANRAIEIDDKNKRITEILKELQELENEQQAALSVGRDTSSTAARHADPRADADSQAASGDPTVVGSLSRDDNKRSARREGGYGAGEIHSRRPTPQNGGGSGQSEKGKHSSADSAGDTANSAVDNTNFSNDLDFLAAERRRLAELDMAEDLVDSQQEDDDEDEGFRPGM